MPHENNLKYLPHFASWIMQFVFGSGSWVSSFHKENSHNFHTKFCLCTHLVVGAAILYDIHSKANSSIHYDWLNITDVLNLTIQMDLNSTLTSLVYENIRIWRYTGLSYELGGLMMDTFFEQTWHINLFIIIHHKLSSPMIYSTSAKSVSNFNMHL